MIEVLWIDDECMTNFGKLSPMGEEFVNYAYEQKNKNNPNANLQGGRWCY